MTTIKEALSDGSLSLEDEIDYDDTPQAEEIALLKLEIERLNNKNEELLTLYTTEREVKDYYKNVTNELEKWLEEQHQFIIEIPAYTKEISIEHKTMEICYENVLDKLQELKGSYK